MVISSMMKLSSCCCSAEKARNTYKSPAAGILLVIKPSIPIYFPRRRGPLWLCMRRYNFPGAQQSLIFNVAASRFSCVFFSYRTHALKGLRNVKKSLCPRCCRRRGILNCRRLSIFYSTRRSPFWKC
jgi:hypothetical protein